MSERLEALESIVAIQNEMISSHLKTINSLSCTINSLEEKCTVKDALINKYRSMLFDTKSEKKFSTKTEEPDSTIDEPAVVPQLMPSRPRGQQKGTSGHGRRQYNKLPLHEVFHELPLDKRMCTKCGKPYVECGTEDSIELDYLVLLKRIMNRRLKYRRACNCDCDKIITAPSASKLIPKGLLSDGLITRFIINKFLHGQPINRQLNEFELHCGVRLAPGTIVGVLDKVSELLRPLYDHILLHLRDANHWNADETRWMQYGDEKKHLWWLWLFSSDDATVFMIDPSRSRSVPKFIFGLDDSSDNIEKLKGILNCDRWKSYQKLRGILAAFCWAHVRRDFIDLMKKYPYKLYEWGQLWVERIGKLYYLNNQRLVYEPSSKNFQIADAELREHVLNMEYLRNTELTSCELNSAAHKALRSLSRHWFGLTLFLDHPYVPLDNNEAERLLRTSVVGRKNFYGSGSLKSGTMAECAYSVLMTAEKNGLNPLTYLWSYLHVCAENNGETPENIESFLPWNATTEDIAVWKLPPAIA